MAQTTSSLRFSTADVAEPVAARFQTSHLAPRAARQPRFTLNDLAPPPPPRFTVDDLAEPPPWAPPASGHRVTSDPVPFNAPRLVTAGTRQREPEPLITPRLATGYSPTLTVGGRRGRFNFDLPPETGGTPRPRYAFETDDGGRWNFQLEQGLQGGRWDDAEHAQADFDRYKALDPKVRTATMAAMWGDNPIASVIDQAGSEGVSFAELKKRLKPYNTHRQISDGEPKPAVVQPKDPMQALSKATSIGAAPKRTIFDRAAGVVRSPAAGVVRVFTKPAWGALEAAADALGLESVAAWSRTAGAQAEDIVTTVRGSLEGAGPTEQAAYSGLESAGMMAPALAAGAVMGSPAVALGVMGAATAAEAYPEARAADVAPLRAAGYAAIQGAAEILTEKIPASRLLGDLAKRTGLVQTVLRQVAVEVPGEQVAELVQSLNDWTTLNPEKPLSEWASQRKSAAAQTLVATLVGTVVQSGGAIAADRLLRPSAPASTPPVPNEGLAAQPSPVAPTGRVAPPVAPLAPSTIRVPFS